ncbi:MAG: sigma 54-interacting transcriptional regulator [Pirellula sp.]
MSLKNKTIFGDPKAILLAISGLHHLPELLPLTVRLLAGDAKIALARIWLIQPTNPTDCQRCTLRDECAQPGTCLHLVSSFGNSRLDPGEHWQGLDGSFRRFPVGVRKVGHIASSGSIVRIADIASDANWIAKPDWAHAEGVTSFIGLPLKYRGGVMGVLALFSRVSVGESCDEWLQMIADHLAAAIANARSLDEIESLKSRLELENLYLREEVQDLAFGELKGSSPALQNVIRQMDLVAPTDASILILGESGTGKELVARELHRRSGRSSKPLIKVNCAAIPRELYESEFFGHAKGAFTGALRDRVGRFELADGGTLFLDEVGEIPLDLQSKLLRVLQEGELERIGEERTRKVNVRIIAATNRNLREESQAGRFRQDLFYRLSVFPIELPPLRERSEDIPTLAEYFLAKFSRQVGKKAPRLTLANVNLLQRYAWPGNIRELQHVLERASILASDGKLRIDLEIPQEIPSRGAAAKEANHQATEKILTVDEMRNFERENIRRALAATGGRVYGQGGAAELLGMRPTTLASRIKALEIDA